MEDMIRRLRIADTRLLSAGYPFTFPPMNMRQGITGFLFTVGGRIAFLFFECGAEVFGIRKSGFISHIGNGIKTGLQQFFCIIDAQGIDIVQRCGVKYLIEEPAEIGIAQVTDFAEQFNG